jgi:endoglucanase
MLLPRCLAVLATFVLWSVLGCASAGAYSFDASGFRLQSSTLYVHENAGWAVITIERGDVSRNAQIRYVVGGVGFPCGAQQCTATRYDFTGTKGMLDFPAGVRSETFSMPIVDHGAYSLPKTSQISLFGPSPIGMAGPSKAVLTILNDDPSLARDARNPLGVPSATPGNVLAGATFYVNPDSAVAVAARRYPALKIIASEPGTARFGNFSWPDAGIAVSDALAKAQVLQPGTVPMLATYRVVTGHCGHRSDPPSAQAAYHNFIKRFAYGIGGYRAVLFLEMDSIITTPCLSPHGVAVRMHELYDAVNVLTANCPRLVIYLDAGAADAIPARQVAHLLNRAGIARIEGFFINSTHFDWTSKEIRFGERVSRMTGGKYFVVNTGENGRGPLVPADRVRRGNEVLCNPSGRGLGPLPTTSTGYPNVNAFAWTSNPGESGGACVRGAPPTGAYWPAYALMLVRNAVFHVDSTPQ